MHSRSGVSVVGAVTTAAAACAFALVACLTPGAAARANPLPADPPPPPSDTITFPSPATVTVLGGQGGETLAVTADSTTALMTMTVHLDDATTGTDTLDLTMTPPAGGAQPGTSTWTSPTLATPTLPPGSYSITVDAADTGGTSVTGVPDGTLPFPSQLRLTAKLSATKVKYGAKVTISGTVGYASGHAVVPLTGQQVHISADGGSPSLTATSDKTGRFTAALPRLAASTDWIVASGGGQYLTSAAVTLPLTVELPTAITGFGVTLNSLWQVSVRGCLGLAPKTPGSLPSLTGLVIQYSPGPHGPWHALGAIPAQKSSACGNGGRTFGARFIARRNYAYYRASFGGSQSKTGKGSHAPATAFLSSLGAAKLAWKYADRFDKVKFAPHTVHQGGKLTVTGKLQSYSGGKWRPLAHQIVQIIFRPKGSSVWYWIVRVHTGAAGGFSAKFADPVTATWSVEYLGDAKHLAAVGPMVSVTLKD